MFARIVFQSPVEMQNHMVHFPDGDVDEEELSLEQFDLSSACSSRNGGKIEEVSGVSCVCHGAMRSVSSSRAPCNSSNKDVSEYFVTSNSRFHDVVLCPNDVVGIWLWRA